MNLQDERISRCSERNKTALKIVTGKAGIKLTNQTELPITTTLTELITATPVGLITQTENPDSNLVNKTTKGTVCQPVNLSKAFMIPRWMVLQPTQTLAGKFLLLFLLTTGRKNPRLTFVLPASAAETLS